MKPDKKVEALWSHLHGLAVLGAMGSYTAAAERLGLSKAAVSQRIRELEQAAGVMLVRRTTRSVQLTQAGQQLVEATQGAFAEIERGFEHVRDQAGEPRGLLRVTAPVALGRQQIVPRVAAFLSRYPGLRLELDLSDRLLSLALEGFDVAIRHVDEVPDTHVAWPLCPTRAVLVAAPDYLQRSGCPALPQALAEHDCLHYLRGGRDGASWRFERLDGQGEAVSVAVRGSFAANNSEALREAALGGLGIALLPDFSAQRALLAGTLREVLPAWRSVGAFGGRLHAIRPYSTQVPRSVQVWVAYLRETLGEGFGWTPSGSA